MRRVLLVILLCALAIAGCGKASNSVTVKKDTPAPTQTVAVGTSRLEKCRQEDRAIQKQNRLIERRNSEVTSPGRTLPLQIEKLCLPPERHPPLFETLAVVERQLAANQVQSALIVKRYRRLHIKLSTGQTAAIEYARHQYAHVVFELRAAGVEVKIE